MHSLSTLRVGVRPCSCPLGCFSFRLLLVFVLLLVSSTSVAAARPQHVFVGVTVTSPSPGANAGRPSVKNLTDVHIRALRRCKCLIHAWE